jgi:signal transduction histidine kinase
VPLGLFLADLAAGVEAELPGLCVDRDFEVPGSRRATLDVDKIRRAVSNVAANARDAMGGDGRLRLSARVVPGADGSPDRLDLVLSDEGPGVPEEIRDRVFEPFVTLGKKRGTGLGLAVARRFVEDHGGTLELLRPGSTPARGAAFRFGLPLTPPADTRLPRRPSGETTPGR